MPVFELYSPDALAGLIGGSGTVTLTEPYDPATDTILTIDDDDGLLGGTDLPMKMVMTTTNTVRLFWVMARSSAHSRAEARPRPIQSGNIR